MNSLAFSVNQSRTAIARWSGRAVCLALLWAFGLVSADCAHAQDEEAAHSLEPGAWALQFGIGNNLSLDSYLGSSISARKHVSAAHAWQFGVSLNAEVGSRESGDLEVNANRQLISLTAHHLTYPGVSERASESIHWYFGVGPRISFNRGTQSTDEGQGEETITDSGMGAGVSALLGAEWFVKRRISLFATYGTSFEYSRSSTQTESANAPDGERTDNQVRLFSEGVRFGVTVFL